MQMTHTVEFKNLTPNQFEELCFDIVEAAGFVRLTWRQGGADSGRDIQGYKQTQIGVVEDFDELWFFECKRHEGGVPPGELNSKIAWADAEKPKHLVIFVSSYITNDARNWLKKIEREKFYKIHLIEGKKLKSLVLRHKFIIDRYFSTDIQRFMQNVCRSWIIYDLSPDVQILHHLTKSWRIEEYSISELALLWVWTKFRSDKVDEFEDPYDLFDAGLKTLICNSNCTQSVLSEINIHRFRQYSFQGSIHIGLNKIFCADIICEDDGNKVDALYCFARDSEGEGLEVLVKKNSSLTLLIRHLISGARGEMEKAIKKVTESRPTLSGVD